MEGDDAVAATRWRRENIVAFRRVLVSRSASGIFERLDPGRGVRPLVFLIHVTAMLAPRRWSRARCSFDGITQRKPAPGQQTPLGEMQGDPRQAVIDERFDFVDLAFHQVALGLRDQQTR